MGSPRRDARASDHLLERRAGWDLNEGDRFMLKRFMSFVQAHGRFARAGLWIHLAAGAGGKAPQLFIHEFSTLDALLEAKHLPSRLALAPLRVLD